MSSIDQRIENIVNQRMNAIERSLDQRFTAMAESMAEMKTENAELRRRLNQMVRFGLVEEIHSSNKLIKVKHGERSTQFIKWLTLSGGEMIHYRCPSVGELALLIDISSGSSSQYIALCGWESDKFPFPISNPKQVLTQFGEMKILWDGDKQEMTIKAPTHIYLDTPKIKGNDTLEFVVPKLFKVNTKSLESTGDVADSIRSMTEDRDIYNSHSNHVGGTPPSVSQ